MTHVKRACQFWTDHATLVDNVLLVVFVLTLAMMPVMMVISAIVAPN